MNIRDNFEGTGIAFETEMAGAMDEALSDDDHFPGLMLIESKRAILERLISQGRRAMSEKRVIIANATAEFRQLKASVRADEDALDSLLASEA